MNNSTSSKNLPISANTYHHHSSQMKLSNENKIPGGLDINEIAKLKRELAEYYNIRDQITKNDHEFLRTKGRSKSQPDIKSVSQRPPIPKVSVTNLFKNIDSSQPRTTKNNEIQNKDTRKRAETARAAHRPQIANEIISRPLSSIRMQKMDSDDNHSFGITDIMNKFSNVCCDEQPMNTERVKRLRVRKHKKKKKPVGMLTQRDIYSAKSFALLPPVNIKSMKTKMHKKKENRQSVKPTTNDAESTNYSKEKSSLSKIQKNKSLLAMFGLEKPEKEKMKKLGVSTLAGKQKKRIFSARRNQTKQPGVPSGGDELRTGAKTCNDQNTATSDRCSYQR